MSSTRVDTIPRALLDRYRRLMEIANDLASTLDLDALLNGIVQAAADVSNSKAASILLYDNVANELFFQASTDIDARLMVGLRVPVEGSIAGAIIKSKQPIIVADVDEDPRHFEKVSKKTKSKTDSILGIPLITKNKVVGVLEALNKRQGKFTLVDQDLLTTLGSQAAVAIENARLFQQSDVIAEMVHELRTPLAGINTASHLLTRPEISEMQRGNLVQMIQMETNRLSEMTTSFLDLARLESGRAPLKFEEVELVSLLEEVKSIMLPRIVLKKLKLEWNVSEDLLTIRGDRNKLKQVALNLISNAIKYNSEKGKISVESHQEGDFVSFSVSDSGAGISEKHIDSLFQKFYRVPGTAQSVQGTGLGLSISKKIVEAHLGKIEVDSVVGKGTKFTVVLPIGEIG
ncbi:MAG: GAF domain-containing sensor histidine kinase [Chloroflexota bacterium]